MLLDHKPREAPMDHDIPAQYTYIWEYLVLPDRVDEFEELYGPQGAWRELFQQSTGYIKTELHRDRSQLNRFVTVDYWESYDAWLDWRALFEARFQQLDRRGGQLTAEEREVGRFHCVSAS
jgi:heme-degrading monooxygenase HmoA